MTLTSTTTKIQYNGDGATVSFPITFVFWLNADIKAIHKDAAGVETTWVLGTQYTLTGGEGSTGTLTVEVSPTDYTPASGETLTIKSIVPSTQTTTLPLGGALPSVAIEERLDKNVRLIQQREEELDRSIKLSETSTASEVILTDPVTGEFLRWKADGSLESAPLSASGTATGVDETDTDTTKDKLTSNALAKRAEDTAQAVNGVQAASAVNKLQVTNSATGNPVLIEATGTDTNINLNYNAKGSGTHVFNKGVTLTTGDVTLATGGITLTTGGITLTAAGAKVDGRDLTADVNMFRGMIDGLTLSNNGTDATNDIDIAVGTCIDSGNTEPMTLSSVLTKQIDANWAVGSAAGGFPSGLTLTNDTWYHVFLIKRTDTGVVDAGFDTSITATNLLSDATSYDAYRRIGSIYYGTATIDPFYQIDNRFYWTDWISEISGLGNASGASLTLRTPPDVACIALLNVVFRTTATSTSRLCIINSLNDTSIAPTNNMSSAGVLSANDLNEVTMNDIEVVTNTSSQVRQRVDDASNHVLNVNTKGWIDLRS